MQIYRMTFAKLSTKNIMTLHFHLHNICRLLILYVMTSYAKLLDNEDSLSAWVIRRTIVADGTLNIKWNRLPEWNLKFGNTKNDVKVTSKKIFFGHNTCHFITKHVQKLNVCGFLGFCLFHCLGGFVICLFGVFLGRGVWIFLIVVILSIVCHVVMGFFFKCVWDCVLFFSLLAKHSQSCFQ